jgi:ketosteroid isomerase-like protein
MAAADAGGGGDRASSDFLSMEPYLRGGAMEGVVRTLYRSQLLRQRMLAMPQESRYRHSAILSLFAWCYHRWNEGRRIPYAVLAPDFEVHQTAALIDTAGSFRGKTALDEVRKELEHAFESVRFEPMRVAELGPESVLFLIRFTGVGRGSGIELDRPVGHLFSFSAEEGNAKRLDVFWDLEDAADATGLDPAVLRAVSAAPRA